ncbi:MAG: hypothetical protein MJ252_18075 [archaeon]|nr:hypothetical protein [archaeon]
MINRSSPEFKKGEVLVKDTYMMLTKERIGSGSFGEIYKGYNVKTQEKLAFKMEINSTKFPQLNQEYKILKAMRGTGKSFKK